MLLTNIPLADEVQTQMSRKKFNSIQQTIDTRLILSFPNRQESTNHTC